MTFKEILKMFGYIATAFLILIVALGGSVFATLEVYILFVKLFN